MKIARFTSPFHPEPVLARVEGSQLQPLVGSQAEILASLAQGRSPKEGGPPLGLKGATLLAPVAPTKIVCVGLNYRHHAQEMGKALPEEPLLFLKALSALSGPGDAIVLPPSSQVVHHEGELALVIGERARQVSAEEALGFVAGVTCMNDVTARDIQHREMRYTRAKGFDSFAPCGPWLCTGLDPDKLAVACRVNGVLRQSSTTADMIFSCAALISFISSIMTLEPGDLISTGTPSGVGPLVHGDTVEVEVEGVGVLSNEVVRAS